MESQQKKVWELWEDCENAKQRVNGKSGFEHGFRAQQEIWVSLFPKKSILSIYLDGHICIWWQCVYKLYFFPCSVTQTTTAQQKIQSPHVDHVTWQDNLVLPSTTLPIFHTQVGSNLAHYCVFQNHYITSVMDTRPVHFLSKYLD